MRTWIADNAAAFFWVSISSLCALAAATLIVPIIVVRIPPDYFASRQRPDPEWMRWPVLRFAFLVAKNVLGYAFIIAGLILLVTPGQGIITLLIGSALADYPGKFRFQRWLLRRRGVIGSINWLRRRAGKDPLIT